MKINRAFIKGTNWALAGLISMLGFTGCDKERLSEEYGTPNADYTIKGTVVNKANGKPIEGIRVGYDSGSQIVPMYGVLPAPYRPKTSVLTNVKGEYKLTVNTFPFPEPTIPVFIDDIDGEENGWFQSEMLEVDFSKAERTGKPNNWYEGEYTVTLNVELTEIVPE